jgi:hypothetical protein
MGVNNGDKEMIVPDWSAVGAAGKVGGSHVNVDGNADYGFLEYIAKDEHNAQFEEHLKDVRDETFFVLQRFALGNYTSLYWTDTSWYVTCRICSAAVVMPRRRVRVSQDDARVAGTDEGLRAQDAAARVASAGGLAQVADGGA